MKKTALNESNILTFINEIDGFHLLLELALDMRWSWTEAADALWEEIDMDLWKRLHNPWAMLNVVSKTRIEALLSTPEFRQRLHALIESKRESDQQPAWFQKNYADTPLKCVAYFCMEFMLSEALPIYSGGLGHVAGDQLKAASDLGVPVVGVGLLYQQGYFRQLINACNEQQACFPCNDFAQLPVMPVRTKDGEWLRIQLDLVGLPITLRVWQVCVGRNILYLLDSNTLANYPPFREITSTLYSGDPRTRLWQEIILGIGGWRLLEALNLHPEVCHLNEGHAAFAILERAKSFMKKNQLSFQEALSITRAGNHFTTHTAVTAGFDRYDPALISQYLGTYAENALNINVHDLLALGRANANDRDEKFNMAYLAIHGSGSINAVSKLHSKVSQPLFQDLFPRWPLTEIPITWVTNGVHVPSWSSGSADKVWSHACKSNPWLGDIGCLEQNIRTVSDEDLWSFCSNSRKKLIHYVRERSATYLMLSGASNEMIEETKHILNPNALTLGFARRFATYKRADLLLKDPSRLMRILSNPERPVQLVIAGKAHPADLPGQALIKEWIEFTQRPEVRPYIIFLSDHDMLLTEQLVQGVDVWINTPRRPWEACGTSGMKVLVNGGLNLSELDGWWVEAYSPEVGWALGDGKEHGEDPAYDLQEANDLYHILENEVIPKFYQRDENNIPNAWVKMVRASMAQLTPQFSTNRVLHEYVEEIYLPAAKKYVQRTADHARIGKEIAHWQKICDEKWSTLRCGELSVSTIQNQYHFQIPIYCPAFDISALRVELYANGHDHEPSIQLEMHGKKSHDNDEEHYVYSVSIPITRDPHDYTVRVIPKYTDVDVPLENTHILWQK